MAGEKLVKAALDRIRAYHASPKKIEEGFQPSQFRGSTFFASSPNRALSGARSGMDEMIMETATKPHSGPMYVHEVEIAPEHIRGLHYTPEEMAWFEGLPSTVTSEDAIEQIAKGRPNPYIDWSDIYNVRKVGDRQYEYTKKDAPPFITYEQAYKTGRDVYGQPHSHYGPGAGEKEAAEGVLGSGMKGYLVQDEAGLSIAMPDPSETVLKNIFNRASGGEVRAGFDEGGFLSKIFSGEDYQSNSEPLLKDGVINWGDPNNPADYVRASQAMMRAIDTAKKVQEEQPRAFRSPEPEPAPIPQPPQREEPSPAPAAAAIETVAPATPAPAPAPQAMPYAPVPSTEEVAKLTNRVAPGPDLTDRQRDLIIRTVAAESSRKTPEESRAIAHVILNRIMSGKYGATPEQVLFAKNQFEPWSDPSGSNYPMKISPTSSQYAHAAQAFDAALGGEDITGGASNFWGPKAQAALRRPPPDFSRFPGMDIGETRFHRVTDVTPRAAAPSMPQQPAQPSVGLFAFGTNDAKPETALKSAQEIVANAQRAGIKPVFVLPNANDPKFAPTSEALRKFAEENGIEFEAPGYDPRDPLHITPKTAQEIAQKYPGAIVAGDSNSWRLQRYGYGRPVADQKSFIDPRSGVTLGRVGAGSSEIAKAFKEYVDSLSKGRADGGEVREHHADGKLVGKALIEKLRRSAPPENSRLTQIATTGPSYEKALQHLAEEGIKGKIIDYGAGRGHGLKGMRADTFEPYPQGWKPTYTDPNAIPDEAYRRLVNLNVLNVLDPQMRDEAVLNMGRIIQPGGGGIISTRGRDVMSAKGVPGPEPMSLIIGEGDAARYQKGFTPRELREYVGDTLGSRFDVDPSDVGAASILFRRNREDGGEVEREHHADGKLVGKALDVIRGYHGSGRKFKEFSADKMGSGAGQMYGRGVYITESPEVARDYRSMGLKGSPNILIGREALPSFYEHLERLANKSPMEEARPLYDRLALVNDLMDRGDALAIRTAAENGYYEPEVLSWFEKNIAPKLKTPGGLYEVQINAKPEQFIHWQRPFSEQSPFIQDVMRPAAVELAERANIARSEMLKRGEDFMGRPYSPERMESLRQITTPEQIGGFRLYGKPHEDLGMTSPGGWSPKANEQLREMGIVGNTYGDKANNRPVQNYVVFDPKDTEILNRYNTGGEVLSDKYPTHYLPNVGRQVMNEGGTPEMSMTRARKLALEELGRSEDKPPMDPAVMGQNWANAVRRFQENPIREGEQVARPLELGARDVIGGAIAGDEANRTYLTELRRRAADALVGSKGLPDSGTLGFGLADLPMVTGVPLTIADIGQSVKEGDYLGAGAGAALPAAFYARGPLGAAGKRALEIAREYATPLATTAGVGATLAPSDAEAAKLPKISIADITHRKLSPEEIRRAYGPHTLQNVSGDERERLIDAYSKLATPHSPGNLLPVLGQKTAEAYRPKTGFDTSSGSYFNVKPSVPKEATTKVETPFYGPEPKAPVQKTWNQLINEYPDSPMISVGGDRSNLTTLYGINEDALPRPTRIHAGFKYMLEPNPNEVWGNAAIHSGQFEKLHGQLKNAMDKDLPVLGVATPMGPQSIDSSRDFTNLLLSGMEGRGIHPTDLKLFTDYLKSGKFMPAKGQAAGAKAMEGFPGFEDWDLARSYLLDPKIPGTIRREFAQGMDKAAWRDRGFPEVGSYRIAATDPYLLNVPSNMIGGRIIEIDPKLFADAAQKKVFEHFTYPASTFGRYVADVPFVQRHYAMPDAVERVMAQYNQFRPPVKKGDPDRPPLIVHPFSSEPTGVSTSRKMFEEQKQVQQLNDRMRQAIEFGESRRADYGYKKGGSVEDAALELIWKRGSK